MTVDRQVAKEIQLGMQMEMVWTEELHENEMKILHNNMGLIQAQYEVNSATTARKIKQLEDPE